MNIDEMLEISDCPLCEGGALLEEECGCSYYVMCLECGCHTVNIDFRSEQERLDAAKKSGYALEYRKSNIKQPRRMRMLNVNFAGGNFSRVLDTFFPLCYNTWQSNEGNDCLCSDFTTGRGVMDCERLAEAVNRRTFRS